MLRHNLRQLNSNEWFHQGDPITAELNLDDRDNHRIRVVKQLSDLSFTEDITVSLEYPGDDQFTLLDPQNRMSCLTRKKEYLWAN